VITSYYQLLFGIYCSKYIQRLLVWRYAAALSSVIVGMIYVGEGKQVTIPRVVHALKICIYAANNGTLTIVRSPQCKTTSTFGRGRRKAPGAESSNLNKRSRLVPICHQNRKRGARAVFRFLAKRNLEISFQEYKNKKRMICAKGVLTRNCGCQK
jgi:hypothetical protein